MAYTNSPSTKKVVRPLTKKERIQRWRVKEEARAKAKDASASKQR